MRGCAVVLCLAAQVLQLQGSGLPLGETFEMKAQMGTCLSMDWVAMLVRREPCARAAGKQNQTGQHLRNLDIPKTVLGIAEPVSGCCCQPEGTEEAQQAWKGLQTRPERYD